MAESIKLTGKRCMLYVLLVLTLLPVILAHFKWFGIDMPASMCFRFGKIPFCWTGLLMASWCIYATWIFSSLSQRPKRKIYDYLVGFLMFFLSGFFGLLTIAALFLSFFGSYANGSYDACMAECLLPDHSNSAVCMLSVCDFPI